MSHRKTLSSLYLLGDEPRRRTPRVRGLQIAPGACQALATVTWLAPARPHIPGPITRRNRA